MFLGEVYGLPSVGRYRIQDDGIKVVVLEQSTQDKPASEHVGEAAYDVSKKDSSRTDDLNVRLLEDAITLEDFRGE